MSNALELYQPEMFGFENPTAGEELLRATPPVHTGERVEKDWERCQEILRAYASGEPIRSVCRRFSIGHNTLARLVERNVGLVDTERKRVSAKLRRVSSLLLDRMEMEAHLIPIQQVGVSLGIIMDKLAMVEMGAAAEGMEQKGPSETVDSLARRLASMKRATPFGGSTDAPSVDPPAIPV